MELDYWTIHHESVQPGSMFLEQPQEDWARMSADAIGRTMRICSRCDSWCWIPMVDSALSTVLETLIDMGWAYDERHWYCPECNPKDGRPSKQSMKQSLDNLQ